MSNQDLGVDVKVTTGPEQGCEDPPPTVHDSPAHRHDDGRVCAWNAEEDSWWTVAAVDKPEALIYLTPEQSPDLPDYPPSPDQHAIGRYGKYVVARVDGRDRPGGDREGAQQGYFVLDPIFDPAARPALAVYAMVVREMGLTLLADDLDRMLAELAGMVGQAMQQMDPDALAVPLRAVTTWTYTAPVHDDHARPRTADQVAAAEQADWAPGEHSLRVLPNG